MKISAMGIDDNGRSTASFIDIPLNKISETEAISNKQQAIEWRIGPREVTDIPRTDWNYVGPLGGGPNEMHVGGAPHFVGVMAGHLNCTLQDGSVQRIGPGELQFVRAGALHNSTLLSNSSFIMFNMSLPGTPADISDFKPA
jgi:hypothetical protein